MTELTPVPNPKMPVGLLVLSIFYLFIAGLFLLATLVLVPLTALRFARGEVDPLVEFEMIAMAIASPLALALFLCNGLGLIRRWRWTWTTSIMTAAEPLASSLTHLALFAVMSGYLEYMEQDREFLAHRKMLGAIFALIQVGVLMSPSSRAYMRLAPGRGWIRLGGFFASGVVMGIAVYIAARRNF